MTKGGNEGEKGKDGKDATMALKSGAYFPLLELPTDVLQVLAAVLKKHHLDGTLASLNVCNKYLQSLTSRPLWESVVWTIRTFKPNTYCTKKSQKVFSYVKYITLVLVGGTDFGPDDMFFWNPLKFQATSRFAGKTVGQAVHLRFPNLKYVVRVMPPPKQPALVKREMPSVYISDRNIIEECDTVALRKMIMDTLDVYGDILTPPQRFSDLDKYVEMQVERLNCSNGAMTAEEADERAKSNGLILLGSLPPLEKGPNRSIAILRFEERMVLHVHLLTDEIMQDEEISISEKVLSISYMLRKLIREDDPISSKPLPMVTIDVDVEAGRKDFGGCGFDRVERWMNRLSLHNSPLLDSDSHDISAFDFFARLPQEFTLAQFRSDAFAFHEFMLDHIRRSSLDPRAAFPLTIEIHGFVDENAIMHALTAKMDFSTAYSRGIICIETMNYKRTSERTRVFYRGGRKIEDITERSRLEDSLVGQTILE